ncbi:TrkH family potassium uptake protein [[Clostridium] polysaccharolyticum]|uniref:Trk system potassium uptake protein TrkH n=1 Tax=[Clostridium] polysaccharolyticum TaxID=29364 RepID=A0A1H9Z795_9FIRM|nr:TrkH family potassium uptake protein [[Clostridium] polysaccharolyticum]SES76930.1 trk system potassium uptake protein TrkH [[Clostridium] polysaccharolyticum]
MFRFRKKILTTTQIIAYGFFITIIIGALLLMLPISSKSGEWTNWVDALFTATTSVCVTGLTTVSTLDHWNFFGHLVILVLIQFGGLGIVTFATAMLLILGKRITLRERMLIQDAYNLDTLRGLVKLTKKIMKGTFIVEGIGAILYCFAFVPQFKFVNGFQKSVFLSVSAFSNAGMDLLGNNSLEFYRGNLLINVVTMTLIILGGLGFPVWWDCIRIARYQRKQRKPIGELIRKFELHSKIVFTVTAFLILGGFVLILLIEWNNPDTLGKLSWWEKGLAAMFQSVTLRTAGFFTIPQNAFHDASSFVFLILMFIGGSPSGTAGGVKTVTVAMLCLAAWSVVKGRKDTEVFHRKIKSWYIKKGLAVVLISFTAMMVTAMLLLIIEEKPFLDILYEAASAIGTVGLTRNITGTLSTAGKLIVICAMYLGRIGPITMALFFNTKKVKTGGRTLPEERIIVG